MNSHKRTLSPCLVVLIMLVVRASAVFAQDSLFFEYDPANVVGGATTYLSSSSNTGAASGDFLFLIRGGGSERNWIDLLSMNEFPPRVLGRADIGAFRVSSYAVKGDRMYLTNARGDVAIYDVSDPFNPVLLNELDSTAFGTVVPVYSGDKMFTAKWEADNTSTLRSIDMTDPQNPKVLVTKVPERFIPKYADEKFLTGIDIAGKGYTFDVERADSLKLLGSYADTLAFTARFSDIGFSSSGVLLDLFNPGNPKPVRRFDSTAKFIDVRLVNGRLYAVDITDLDVAQDHKPSYALSIYDMLNPGRPNRILRQPDMFSFEFMGFADSSVIVQEFQYVDSVEFDKVFVPVQIGTDPKNPFRGPIARGPLAPQAAAVVDGDAYVASPEGMAKMPIDGTEEPTIDRSREASNVRSMAPLGNSSIVGINGNRQLTVFGTTGQLQQLGSLSNVQPGFLSVANTHAFVTHNGRSITSVDLGNPRAPRSIDSADVLAEMLDMHVDPATGLSAVAFGNPVFSGVQLFDFSNPAALKGLGVLDDSKVRRPQAVAIHNGRLVVLNRPIDTNETGWSLQTWDIGTSGVPVRIDEKSGSGTPFDFSVTDSFLLASIHGGSIHAFTLGHDGRLRVGPILHIEATADLVMQQTVPGEYEVIAIAGGSATALRKNRRGLGGLRRMKLLHTTIAAVSDPAGENASLELETSYPNPARDGLTLTVRLPRPADLSLVLYDMGGNIVRTILEGPQEAGTHVCPVDLEGLPAGSYVARLRSGSELRSTIVTVAR